MEYAGYVLGGYGVVFGALGAYALWLVRRGRETAKQVPSEHRRWSDS